MGPIRPIGPICFALLVSLSFLTPAPASELDDLLDAAPPPPYTLTDWESEFLERGLPKGPAPKFLDAEDGLALAYREFTPEAWDGKGHAILLIPGSSAHSGQLVPLGQALAARGVFVRAVDTRGHGLSLRDAQGRPGSDPAHDRSFPDDATYYPGRIGDCLDPDQIVRDIQQHLDDLRAAWPNAHLHLGGHSSGGGSVSRYAEKMGADTVDSFILIAPFNHFRQPQNIPAKNSRYSILSPQAMGQALAGEPHRYVLGFNLRGVGRPDSDPAELLLVTRWTFTMTQAMAATSPDAFWSAYTKPLLWIAGENDELFDLNECRAQHARAPARGAFHTIPNTSHLGLQWSPEVAQQIADWCENQK